MPWRISGWEKSNVTKGELKVIAVVNVSCASAMEETRMSPTLISQAPLSHDCQQGIFVPGVPGAMPPKKRHLL